jgi:hypothetical protein
VTIPGGSSYSLVRVTPKDNSQMGPDQPVLLRLKTANGGTGQYFLSSDPSDLELTGTILDDDTVRGRGAWAGGNTPPLLLAESFCWLKALSPTNPSTFTPTPTHPLQPRISLVGEGLSSSATSTPAVVESSAGSMRFIFRSHRPFQSDTPVGFILGGAAARRAAACTRWASFLQPRPGAPASPQATPS